MSRRLARAVISAEFRPATPKVGRGSGSLQHHLPSLLALVTPTIDPETGVSINDF
jgi:hypothetical protein